MGLDKSGRGRVNGPTILLGSGVYFDITDPLNPPPTIEDIAYGLASRPRWSGQTIFRGRRTFYTVAQHCAEFALHLHQTRQSRLAWLALHHEDGEFVWGDLGGPLKSHVPEFKLHEKATCQTLCEFFGAVPDEIEATMLKELDRRWMATERAQLMNWNRADRWEYLGDAEPIEGVQLVPLDFDQSASFFLAMFRLLKEFAR